MGRIEADLTEPGTVLQGTGEVEEKRFDSTGIAVGISRLKNHSLGCRPFLQHNIFERTERREIKWVFR